MGWHGRKMKAFRRRLKAIHSNYNPKYKAGDLLVARTHKGPLIEIIDIVADQYKYKIDNEELPLYEFTDVVDTLYEEV